MLRLSTLSAALALGFAPSLSSAQMFLPGTFEVSDTGAAVYTIPIEVPPGTAGMQPSLSLQYNSGGGNGILGVGWSLTGLPAITRCPQTMAQDGVAGGVNFDTNDRFCLEGERLIATSGTYAADGTNYSTERDGFSKVISHGTAGIGPAWFEVHTKAGQVMQFGNTPDSQVLAQGKSTARLWALNKVSDTKGDYFTVTYSQDSVNGQFYPTRINYTGNAASPYASVQFVYGTRPDVSLLYQAGAVVRTMSRLTNVQTFLGSTLVRDYRLAYQQSGTTQRSEVTSVTQCTGAGTCLPATAVGWLASTSPGHFGGVFAQDPGDWPNFWSSSSGGISDYGQISGDFNGDGKTDFLLIAGENDWVFLSNGDGTFTSVYNPHPNGWPNFWAGPTLADFAQVSGDFNGDGKTDFLLVSGENDWVFLSNGDGTFRGVYNPHPSSWPSFLGNPPLSAYGQFSGDFNGDGKADFLLVAGENDWVFLSNGDGTFNGVYNPHPSGWPNFWCCPTLNEYGHAAGDFNGDGKTDFLLVSGENDWVFLSNGDGTFNGVYNPHPPGWPNFLGNPSLPAYGHVSGDFNGDGLMDFLLVAGENDWVFLSNGDGTFSGVYNPHPSSWPNFWDVSIDPPNANPNPMGNYAFFSGDFNADGKSDFLLMSGGNNWVFVSNGDGTFTGVNDVHPSAWPDFWNPNTGPVNPNGPLAAYGQISGDFNGDGQTDFLLVSGNVNWVFLSNGPPGDRLSSITTGVGATTRITSSPLTLGGGLYAKDTGTLACSYPCLDVTVPMYVTSQVSTTNGAGGTYISNYSYAGAKADLSGRGFLGFRQVTATDAQTGIATTTNYQQTFPYTGLVARRTKTLGSLILNSTTDAYSCVNETANSSSCSGQGPGTRYFVSLQQSVEQSYDLNGMALPTVTTTNQYDLFGNATQVSVSTSDGYSKTTTNTYTNDTTNWFLGRLTGASVTSTTP